MELAIYLVSGVGGHNSKSKKWPPPFLCGKVNHIRQCILIHAIDSPNGHTILVYDVWLFNINSPFFLMTIMFDLLNWLFTNWLFTRNEAFSIQLALTVPVAATPIDLGL